ncbi:MAG TPA: amidophosphoribosyltransferase [Candidatus Scubalenecus merdavium]|uniref:Amidophosphoribosyltransferase n=1 Tax=Candidatus Scybalenecus merdavium TaxID=2840939 RepID=A0A9D1MVG8_9FIRM|nr:amidophosphoribosyltransferase [Candidatus Scubalenecus merdavium]
MFDQLHEECGVFGIYENKTCDVAHAAYLALYALQHRGQESCGIAVNDRGVFAQAKGSGLVQEVFTRSRLESLGLGNIAVGHVRYSTTGGNALSNIQPLVIRHMKGNMAIAHNGNLVNAFDIRRSFELTGAIFHSTSDTESIAYSIVRERLKTKTTEQAIEHVMTQIRGAYACVVMTATKLIAFRDPQGFRPLCIGRLGEQAYVVASESCALDSIGAAFVRDVLPGEIVVFENGQMRSIKTHCGKTKPHICVFEYIYFARPDSVIEGSSVQHARMRAGRFLAQESPVDADIVIGVPDSGIDAALGYAQESGIPYGIGFIKNKYIGRSFIQPTQGQREDAVRIKLNTVRENIAGKRVIMIDDSIVRGTTCARIVQLLRDGGANEVHVRISSPPFRHPCFFGTDVDSQENLIACQFDTIDEIAREIGADSLAYLSVEATHHLAEKSNCSFCDGCFTGHYPIAVPSEQPKDKFEEKIQ